MAPAAGFFAPAPFRPLTESNTEPKLPPSPSPSPIKQSPPPSYHPTKKRSPPQKREIVEVVLSVEDCVDDDVAAPNDVADCAASENDISGVTKGLISGTVTFGAGAGGAKLRHPSPEGITVGQAPLSRQPMNGNNNNNACHHHHHHHNVHQKRRLTAKRSSATPSPNISAGPPSPASATPTPIPTPASESRNRTANSTPVAATQRTLEVPSPQLASQQLPRASPPSGTLLRSQMRLDLQKERLKQEEEHLLENSLREQSFRIQHEYDSIRRFTSPLEESRRRLMTLAKMAEARAK